MAVLGVEYGAKYTLVGPDGTIATFNDASDPNFVGALNPESSGLDSPDVREDAADVVEGDGGIHGDFYAGRRPVVLQGTIIANGAIQRNERIDKLSRASMALRGDSQLSWINSSGNFFSIALRRQQPLRVTKGFVKDFQLPLVAADPRIYGISQVITKTYTQPEEGLSSSKAPGAATNSALGGGTVEWINPENAKVNTGGGSGLATLPILSGEKLSKALLSSNNGFAIPAEATIVGIECQANIWLAVGEGIGNGPGWGVVQLVKAGALAGENKGLPGSVHSWPSSNFTYTWGSSTDMWGTTWTPAQINAANFGLALVAKHFTAQAPTKEGSGVDWFTTKVFYKVGTEMHAQTVTTNGAVSTPPIITVYGQVLASGIVIKNTTTGAIFETKSKPLAGQNLVLDFSKKTATLFGTGTDEYKNVVFDPNGWWELAPGANFLELPPSSKVEIAWRDAWM